jgi:enoyl-[acyl-carrier protein] reductase II
MDLDSVFKMSLCERLKIKYPIFQAGMGFVAHTELAAAVSNAG